MILVAVGTQFAFDRLVETVDRWAQDTGRTDVVAQIGPAGYAPVAMKTFGMIPPAEFAALQRDADVIIAHAGMGSILGALEWGRPIIIMPRRFALGEHRNDHQLATATRFADVDGIHVAADETALRGYLDRLDEIRPPAGGDRGAAQSLIDRLRAFTTEPPAPWWRRSGREQREQRK